MVAKESGHLGPIINFVSAHRCMHTVIEWQMGATNCFTREVCSAIRSLSVQTCRKST